MLRPINSAFFGLKLFKTYFKAFSASSKAYSNNLNSSKSSDESLWLL